MAKSILQDTKECFLCRMEAERAGYYGELPNSGLHKHHVLYGSGNRKLSEHYGLWVWLCAKRHHEYGPDAVHTNSNIRTMLSQIAQKAFEEKYSHELYMEKFKKNWLDEEEPDEKTEWQQDGQAAVEFIDTGIGELPF